MAEEKARDWQVPLRETPGEHRVGWISELIQTGDRFVKGQQGIKFINDDIKLLMGTDQKQVVKSNAIWADYCTFVETIADLNQIATLGSKAAQFKKYVETYNGVYKHIFWNSDFLGSLRSALQWALLGRGYLWLRYNRDNGGWGKAKNRFVPLGPFDVLPEQLPASNEIQGSYAVTIIEPMPIWEAHSRFHDFQEQLEPISRYDWKTYGTSLTENRLSFYDRWRFGATSGAAGDWLSRYCVPLDSEILTRDGWKKYNEIVIGQDVMGYNQETKRCEWTKLSHVNLIPNQEVTKYWSKKFSVRCTKDHRWVVKKPISWRKRKRDNLPFYAHNSVLSPIDDCSVTDILIQAAPCPEGSGLKDIEVGSYIRKGRAVEMVIQMTSGERRAFILGMLYGEGSSRKYGDQEYHSEMFAQLPGPVYDAMKLACFLEGIATSVGYLCNKNSTSNTKVFSLFRKPHRKIEFRRDEPTMEDVWCPTTELETWVMRQGDVITITGNCEIRRTFIRDLRINTTGKTIQMGTPGSSWGYVVPSVGDLLVTVNPFTGLPESRKATEEDCRIYPQLRMIVTSPTVPVPMYDDTAIDWHGQPPVVEYDVNRVPWSPYGQSVIHGVASLERARRELLSLNDETVKVNTDPPLGWDFQSGVKPDQLTKLKLLSSQGVRIGTKGDPSKALRSILPEGQKTTGENWKDLEVLEQEIKKNLGLSSIESLRELKMNLSGENFEKFLENLGPLAKGFAHAIGAGNGKIAQMLKYNIAQHIPVAELIDMVGPEGVAIETYDNDPNSLVPGRLPGEVEGTESRFNKRERAKWFVEKLAVISKPEELLNITQMQEQMRYMFLFQKGAKLPTETYMEKFGIIDYPAQLEAWKAEQISEAEWKLEVQALLQAKMKELGLEPPPDKPGQGEGGGRPNVHSKPPHAEKKGSKDGNVRAVNSTS